MSKYIIMIEEITLCPMCAGYGHDSENNFCCMCQGSGAPELNIPQRVREILKKVKNGMPEL